MAVVLTYPERVTQYNIEKLRHRVLNGEGAREGDRRRGEERGEREGGGRHGKQGQRGRDHLREGRNRT